MLPILKDMRNMLWVFEMPNMPKIGLTIEFLGRPHTEPILKENSCSNCNGKKPKEFPVSDSPLIIFPTTQNTS